MSSFVVPRCMRSRSTANDRLCGCGLPAWRFSSFTCCERRRSDDLQQTHKKRRNGTMIYTRIPTCILLLIFGFVVTHSESIVGDRPFLSFTNEKSNIGVEVGFSIPLMKVPVEKRLGEDGNFLSAPIEVNLPALAIAATMFVASTAFVPKVFQLLWPVLKPPSTAEEHWRRDNTSTVSEHWKSELDLDNIDKYPLGNDVPESLGLPLTSPRSRATSRKLGKRFPKPHRFPASCESFCNRTNAAVPLSKRNSQSEIDPK